MFHVESQKNECMGAREEFRNLFKKHLPWEFMVKMKGGQTGGAFIFLPLLWFVWV